MLAPHALQFFAIHFIGTVSNQDTLGGIEDRRLG